MENLVVQRSLVNNLVVESVQMDREAMDMDHKRDIEVCEPFHHHVLVWDYG